MKEISMENIQKAVQSALDAKPVDFKEYIYNSIQQKVDDTLFLKRMQVANQIFNNHREEEPEGSDLAPEEENVDEDL
jgi:hypothetical protein